MSNMEIDPRFTITREEAKHLVPDLVAFTENSKTDWDLWEKINAIEVKARRGQKVIVAQRNYETGKHTYIRAKVSSVTRDWRNEDGPVIRVVAGNISWRVDGSDHFLPEPK